VTLPSEASGRLRQAYHELLLWGIYAREGRIEGTPAEALKRFALERVRICRDVLAQAGVERNNPLAQQWYTDAEHLLVAFFDNAARRQVGDSWKPVQQELYQHQGLGQEVFERIEVLAQTAFPAEAPVEALEVFHRCLLLNYHGAASDRQMSPDLLSRFAAKLVASLQRTPPPLAPGLSGLSLRRRWTPLVRPLGIVGAAVALLVLLAGGVWLGLYSRTSDVERVAKDAMESQPACR
jgi:type VI protein secretion system component VasF